MEEQEFQTGQTVQLNSGGPIMTVIAIVPAQEATADKKKNDLYLVCGWFDKNDHYQRADFFPAMLKPY